ncbi:signal recognition particle receptor subunit alpha [Candidatus Mycoplasma haematohominis]|uniref:signal recognition particle receptor subunit alpha n=1 Tax=Candidatus Mycoplasma haematohominis TaxID=1494318 RepID=UPI001C0A6DD7|nr:signal recognition particle receptor subunit alpha [Candidatus Mycoplasma haemohominis]
MFSLGARGIIGKYLKHRVLSKDPINEKELDPILKEIRTTLLNSDVNLTVIKDFLDEIKNDLLVKKEYEVGHDADVIVFSAIKKKLIKILGEKSEDLNISNSRLNKVLVIGLNGSGKTTTTAKLSNLIKKKNSINVRNISLDIYRPGAYEQLKQLSDSVGIPCIETKSADNFKEVIKSQISSSEEDGTKCLFFDNYGLFPDNEKLIEETAQLKKLINPTETIFVLDAMSGQEILETVRLFHEKIGITGIVVSKTDSNAPMGGVFSISYLLKIPIKYMGKGEHIGDIDKFHPERVASVILGEGDILSLVEKAESNMSMSNSQRLIHRVMNGQFDLNDLMLQIKEFKKMGSVKSFLKMLPSSPLHDPSFNFDNLDSQINVWEILISSMTIKERKHPKLFKKQPNRKIRVIKGSGRKPDELNKLLKRWESSKKKMEEIAASCKRGKNIFNFLSGIKK